VSAEKSRRGRNARRKGADWEREVARDMSDATGTECRRCLIEVQQGNKGDIASDAPYAIQCKVGQRPNPWKAYREAADAATGEDLAVAILKKNGNRGEKVERIAVMDLDDFYRIVRHLHGRSE